MTTFPWPAIHPLIETLQQTRGRPAVLYAWP